MNGGPEPRRFKFWSSPRSPRWTETNRPNLPVVALALGLLLLAPVSAAAASTHAAVATTSAPSTDLGSKASVAPATVPASRVPGSEHPTLASLEKQLAARGVPTSFFHPPALWAEGKRAHQPVEPLYTSAPAPMGVADIGLREVGGSMVGYEFNTSSAEGTIALTNAESVYVDGDGPDMFGVQFNAVLANVTLFGNSSYQFWAQSFVSYTPSSGELAFGDEVWNWTNLSGVFPANVVYAHGPNGTIAPPVLYYAVGPTYTIHYPFSVTFYLNSTTLWDRPAVFFNYTLSNTSFRVSSSFDYLVFNSSAGTPTSPAPIAPLQVNGLAYNNIGFINDLELSIEGTSDGATTSFYQMDASMSLAYWNATRGTYVPVPSAVNAGQETGETSDGIASYYTGASAVAQLRVGPSFLTGLWNTTTPPGERDVALTLHPAAAFVLANPGATLNESAAQWVPGSPTGATTFAIPNTGSVYLHFELSEYAPAVDTIGSGGANSTIALSVTLAPDVALGIYTPIIAWGNAELGTFAQSGTGTASDPYVLYDNEGTVLDPEFAQANEFFWPVFPGLLLIGTTAYVDVTPASFSVSYPSWMQAEVASQGVPSTNNLQDQFWQVENVTVEGGSIAGWLSVNLTSGWPLGEVIFWNSTGNLVLNNTLDVQSDGLAFFGGANNTVWGNRFLPAGVATSDPSAVLNAVNNETGIWESESGDLLYNNYFTVPEPAYTPSYNPLSCQVVCLPAAYSDAWNIPQESASAVRVALGQNLTGSILGTWYQGGNFWSNYGTPANPYGVLPYVNRANNGTYAPSPGQILVGGDYVPLVLAELYPVTFQESGLPAGTTWGVATANAELFSTSTSLAFSSPNGTVPFATELPNLSGYAERGPTSFAVHGASVVVDLSFSPVGLLTFEETGLAVGHAWQVAVNGTGTNGTLELNSSSTDSILFALPSGSYTFAVTSLGYAATPASGSVLVATVPREVNVSFTLVPTLTFSETGLPSGAPWSVALSQAATTTTLTSTGPNVTFYVFDAAPGAYTFTASASGYSAAPSAGNGTLPSNSTVEIRFTANAVDLAIYILQPSCLDLFLNGSPLASSACGELVDPLPPGMYEVTAAAAGYRNFSANVTLTPGRPATLYLSLVPLPSSPPAPPTTGTWTYLVVGILAALVVVLLVLVVLFARRRSPPPASPPRGWKPPAEEGGPGGSENPTGAGEGNPDTSRNADA